MPFLGVTNKFSIFTLWQTKGSFTNGHTLTDFQIWIKTQMGHVFTSDQHVSSMSTGKAPI